MSRDETILRFEDVSFEYAYDKPILRQVNFSMRQGSKFALMGQNGAGKSTLFHLLTNDLQPDEGQVHVTHGLSVATARQVIPRDQLELNVRQFFEVYVPDDPYKLNQRIDEVLEIVHLKAPLEKKIKTFSGGQQARLLLASALIQDPDILLLDEPTNNLDPEGIDHLTSFLIAYHKSCIVISHDADFLNAFTDGVLYLDVFTQTVERYVGNYFDVVEQIAVRLEKENMKNAQLAKKIQENKDKANFFAHKGGKMRLVAKRMREEAEELEEAKVDVRKEDKTIRPFTIPAQQDVMGELMRITAYTTMKHHQPKQHTANISLKKNMHLLLSGPNGIGKSTLLEALATGASDGAVIAPNVRVGYYRQDFSTLNFADTVLVSLAAVMDTRDEELLRSTAAGFLITAQQMDMTIGSLSEGQKGLVAFARLVLQKPGLLILDEPTNHINFRHVPIIAAALNEFRGAMILVSHVPEFVAQIRIDETLDLNR